MKVSELVEGFGYTLGSKQHAEAIAKARGKLTLSVLTLKSAVRGSTMSARDEEAIMDALTGMPDKKALKMHDIEQIAAIADVDLGELKELLNL